jgi:BirA family transcriptional regulator, biotin operon repressor / biotin---[acetyl-CoA-carboxylase] ligase
MTTWLHYSTLDSTQLEYKRLAGDHTDENTYEVMAKEQNNGFGREGNVWYSPSGGLWLTLDLKIPSVVPSFALYIGFCVHFLLSRLFTLSDLKIKWPNDIYLGDRKLVGILCEHQQNNYITGIGINTNNTINDVLLKYNAANLINNIRDTVSINWLAKLLVNEIRINRDILNHPEKFITYCNQYLYGLGHQAKVIQPGLSLFGKISGLSETGELLLMSDSCQLIMIEAGSLEIHDSKRS